MSEQAPDKTYVPPSIFGYSKKLEDVDAFVYLGSTIYRSKTLDEVIGTRISKAYNAYSKLEARLWSQSVIAIATKVSVYEACVLEFLLYGCETWPTYRRHIKRFHETAINENPVEVLYHRHSCP